MTILGLLFYLLSLAGIGAWVFWLTRNDYIEGYRAGHFEGAHGMDNAYAEDEVRL